MHAKGMCHHYNCFNIFINVADASPSYGYGAPPRKFPTVLQTNKYVHSTYACVSKKSLYLNMQDN